MSGASGGGEWVSGEWDQRTDVYLIQSLLHIVGRLYMDGSV